MIFHLGYPKCASTKLQIEFANSDCIFLGCNPKNKVGEFYCDKVGTFFDSIFRFGTDKQFNHNCNQIKNDLLNLNQQFKNKLVLSLESTIKRIIPFDLPTDIKIERLAKVIPSETTFVILHRPVKEHLFSQYRDFINCGYAYSFSDFISEMNLVWDYGFVSDLCLENIYRLLSKSFPLSKIILSDVSKAGFISKVFSCLDLNASVSNQKINKGISVNSYLNHLKFNKSQSNKMSFLDMIELHRVFPNANIDDTFKFKYARMRNKHRKLSSEKKLFDKNTINSFNWPSYVNKIQNRNKSFLSQNRKNLINL